MKEKIKLSKVAADFSMGLEALVDFFADKGHKLKCRPDTEISQEMYILLCADRDGIPQYSELQILGRKLEPFIFFRETGFLLKEDNAIWEVIIANAKLKFIVDDFRQQLGDPDEETADLLLFMIMLGFAKQASEEEIAEKINSGLEEIGRDEIKGELGLAISGKDTLLKQEIYLTKVAYIMDMEGYSMLTIYDTIKPLLSPKAIQIVNSKRGRRIFY